MKTNFTEVMLTNKHPTIVIAGSGVIQDCNDAMAALLRVEEKSELLGVNYLTEFVDETERAAIQENILNVLDGSPTWGYQNAVFDHAGVKLIKYWSAVKHPHKSDTLIAWASDLDGRSSSSKELHKFIDAFVHHLSKPIATLLLLESSLNKADIMHMGMNDLYSQGISSISEHVELLRVFNQSLIEHVIELTLKDIEKVLKVSHPEEQKFVQGGIKIQPSLLFLLQRVIQQFRERNVAVSAYIQNAKVHFVFKALYISTSTQDMSRPLVFHLLRIGLFITECGEVDEGDSSAPIIISFDIASKA